MTYLESSFVNFNTTDLKFVFNEFSSDLLKTEEVDHVGLLWTDFFTLPGSFWPPEGMTLGRLLCMRERERMWRSSLGHGLYKLQFCLLQPYS